MPSLHQLPGAYRHLIYRPADMEWELLRYDAPNAELAVTDLQLLEHKRRCAAAAAADSKLPPPLAPAGITPGGRHIALRLSFTLPTSSYATMLIRELTKQPTDVEHHAALTQAHPGSSGVLAPKDLPSGDPIE